MNTKTTFTMLALLAWMVTFCVIVVSALQASCFFLHDTYQKKLLLTSLVNMVCVVYLISIRFYSKQNIGDE
jgi:uncharacterized membrane protein